MGEFEKYIIDNMIDELEEDSGDFIIDNDEKAEWSIKKIAEERAEAQRYISVCQDAIKTYQDKIEKAKADLDNKTGYLTHQLQRYMNTVKAKESKTQKTYKLPSGTLKVKYPEPEYKRDEEKLTEFLKKNYTDYVETIYKPKWAEFKKIVSLNRDAIVDEESGELIDYTPYYLVDPNGKAVEGVVVIEREPVFEVQI